MVSGFTKSGPMGAGAGKRPVRRLVVMALLAALAAVPLVASGGTGVPFTGQQASAAVGGSFEVLVDGKREFAGATRYETSLAAARQYFDTASAAGTPSDTVIVASGESLIDAAASAGLAGAVNAPVLLTTPDRLFVPVAHLIEGAGVSKVIVVGGEAVVSERVVAALRGVPGVQSVERVGGKNRFETAALVARRADLKNEMCENYNSRLPITGGKVAILVEGDSDNLAHITIAGPLAYALGLPILLTTLQGLPDETIAMMVELNIENVIVIGADLWSERGDKIEKGLPDIVKIATLLRITGIDHFGTSVDVIGLFEFCFDEKFSNTSVALISDTALADGISAAPMLGQGLNDDGRVTPVLLVESDNVPKMVQGYLLENKSYGKKIYTIGGESAISSQTVKTAVDVANGKLPISEESFDNKHDRCRLLSSNDKEFFSDLRPYHVTTGFPLPPSAPVAKGVLRVATLFLDYPDAQASHSADEEAAMNLELLEEYYKKNSYEQLDLEFIRHDGWVRATSVYDEYLQSELLAQADDVFSNDGDYHALIVISPSTHFSGGLARGNDYAYVNSALRESVINAPSEWWSVAAHELAHTFGLDDLYSYDSRLYDNGVPPAGKEWVNITLGRMYLPGLFLADANDQRFLRGYFSAVEMLAWSRWQLGWLKENQVECVAEPTFDKTFTLSPIAAPDGTAMVVVPVYRSNGVVIEARKRIGYDTETLLDGGDVFYKSESLPYEGIVVYEVDPSNHGQLPIRLWPGTNDANPLELSSSPILEPGSSISGILKDGSTLRVAVDSEDGLSYIVRVTRS